MNTPRNYKSLIRRAFLALSLCTAALVAGCSAPGPNQRQIDELSQLRYPTQVPTVRDVDIVAIQSRTQVKFVNREPFEITNAYVWLNRQYVGFVRRIQIGNEAFENTFDLDQFYNLHKIHYPVGGLLSPDRGFPLTTVDIYDPGTQTMYRTVVRTSDNLFQ